MLLLAIQARASEVVDTRRSPHTKLQSIPLADVAWTEGFWAERFATLRERSIPAMWELMRDGEYKPFLGHFKIAAGDAEGAYHGAPWNDGDFYKFLEAVTTVYAVTRDPQLAAILDESIPVIAKAQRDDGYLHTPVLIAHRNGDESLQPFADRHNFEMYNMGHLLTAACLHHRVTGDDRFLEVARRTADFLCRTFAAPTPELARNSVCPSHYMGAIELYRTTGDKRYMTLAQTFLGMRNLGVSESGQPIGGDDNQDRIPFVEQREAAGHAVRANYLYAGAADLYLETGDEKLLKPLNAIWHNVVEQKLYITGGCGALYDGASPDGSEQQEQLTRVHQAYGRNYQLPNATAHNETCAAIGNVLWNWRMFLATGEVKYIDVIELSLYNAILAGTSLDGDDFFYVNPLRNVEPQPTPLRWSRTRVPFVTSFCCPPNVLRTLAEIGGMAYSRTESELWVNLYGGNRIETELGGQPFAMSQQTDYPWGGRIDFSIEECREEPLALKLRIPAWCEGAMVRLDGEELSEKAVAGEYFTIERAWTRGDRVTLTLPMSPRLIEAHPQVEETRNQLAVQRGPIVYCLESPDLPAGVRVHEIVIDADVPLNAKHDDQLLGGVTVVETTATVRSGGDWKGRLYRPSVRDDASRSVQLRLIPYYAWANRGASEMSVWLPRH
ncbi:glycoside hydrolase family 127 protein [Lacipirellula sp.]|uniref:glycoside hydrolase family 127 protein n=1 Tax=Lacipirellula sp. TaxID=2691419 RepID=UPI003D12A85F